MLYNTQVFISNVGIYYRLAGYSYMPWVCVTKNPESLVSPKPLIAPWNYQTVCPNVDDIREARIDRLLFYPGSSEIPAGLPFTVWPKGSIGTLITTSSEGDVEYRAQVLITTTCIYMRYASATWERWSCLVNSEATGSNVPTKTVANGGSILEGVKDCYASGYKRLIVEAGDYDIIQEYKNHYGGAYFDNYAGYETGDPFDRGIWLENIEVVFSPGAKVSCHYTGGNDNVTIYFSPFSCGNNVTIDGLVMTSSNVRYGIHPDYNTGEGVTSMTIRNCEFWHERGQDDHQIIGCGFGMHVAWEFENCIFHTTKALPTVRIHNNVGDGAQSRAIFRNCYIDGPGYFLFQHYGSSQKVTNITVTGCSYATAPVGCYESGANVANVKLVAFNNEKRTS